MHVAQDYTKSEVAVIIRNGKLPPSQDALKPPPPLYMPSWKSVLAKEEVDQSVEYLRRAGRRLE